MTTVVPEGDQLDQASRELWYVVTRRQQLLNRQTVLLEIQEFLKSNSLIEDCGNQKKEEEEEEEEGPSELEKIQSELQCLSEKERELVNRRSLWEKQAINIENTPESPATAELDCVILERKKDLFGVCVLPRQGLFTGTSEEVVAVQDLTLSAATVYCPTCQQRVTTEIHYKVGKSSFFLCFASITLGCVAGCCLLPFFVNYFKDVSHRCPSCHAEIRTVHRL
ncbi:hypothetical protein NFI96_010587 [Prochilodus magdalenae]|nr:hypothetical protein NFI96_010587 [Prochilodus magdalenae]